MSLKLYEIILNTRNLHVAKRRANTIRHGVLLLIEGYRASRGCVKIELIFPKADLAPTRLDARYTPQNLVQFWGVRY